MATQGLVTICSGGRVVMKAVAGCDGYNAESLAQLLRAQWPVDGNTVFKEAQGLGFGCIDCLVVMTEDETWYDGDDELSELYRQKFQEPEFNPRWEHGIADYPIVVEV